MNEKPVLRQREWTEDELKAEGFQYFEPAKQLVMARLLVISKDINIKTETITGKIGDVICYKPGTEVKSSLDDYEQWPVRRDIFFKNYKAWDEPGWQPGPVEQHLMDNGCKPYYKSLGVWAQRLHQSRQVQSLESRAPVVIPAGYWLIIGVAGEPYSTPDYNFRSRYIVPQETLKERMYWATITEQAAQKNDAGAEDPS